MIEIERKFLIVSDNYKKEAHNEIRIVQGFLNTHKERAVRIRIKGTEAFITVKGISNKEGTTRFEWEKEIIKQEAEDLLLLCEPSIIEKTRYLVSVGLHTFEIDEFYGDNKGLIIAEVELNTESEYFTKPNWLGFEVTGDIKYYNSSICKHPFKDWK